MTDAVAPCDYRSTFLSALAALQSHCSSPQERRGANDWLLAFQRTRECWAAASSLLLDPSVPPHVQVRAWGAGGALRMAWHGMAWLAAWEGGMVRKIVVGMVGDQ